MMQAGKFIWKVTIQKPDPASARDAAGQRVTAWLPVATNIWANVQPLSSREAFLAAQRQESTTHRVTVHNSPQVAAIDASHRILFGSRIFLPDGPPINPEERSLGVLVIKCTEGLRTEN